MNIDDFLGTYSYLERADIMACAAYCASQRCIDDQVPNFCQGCSLDSRTSEPCENPDVAEGVIEVGYDEEYEDVPVDVWESAADLLRQQGE